MRRTLLQFLTLFMLLSSAYAPAAEYVVDNDNSKVTFAGEQAETPFEGVFESWQAKIDFDPTAPESSFIAVTIDMAAAKTGNAMYDGTLPKEDWFNSAAFPKAEFKTTKITKEKDGVYKAEGDLTIKGISKPVSFLFSLDETKTPEVRAQSSFTVDRLAYDIGKESDAEAEWVSQEIAISLDIKATKK